jgi:hypothetical protein
MKLFKGTGDLPQSNMSIALKGLTRLVPTYKGKAEVSVGLDQVEKTGGLTILSFLEETFCPRGTYKCFLF